MSADDSYLTPAEIAKELRIGVHRILNWIADGTLRAINLATNPSGRPRWRLSRKDLDEFLTSRTHRQAAIGRREIVEA